MAFVLGVDQLEGSQLQLGDNQALLVGSQHQLVDSLGQQVGIQFLLVGK